MTKKKPVHQKLQFTGLAFWLILVFVVAWTGAQVSPGIAPADWYESLNKPSWTPPGWLFGPVWTTLYTMMGIAAWLIWKEGGFTAARKELIAFLIQLFLNGLWSQLFFNFQQIGLALIEILLLLAAIIYTTILFFRRLPLAGWLMVPYIIWVSYATALTAAIWMMN
jgi:translocator protein